MREHLPASVPWQQPLSLNVFRSTSYFRDSKVLVTDRSQRYRFVMNTIVINADETPARASDARRIVYPAVGSPYYIDAQTGLIAFLSPPGTPMVTSEDVRRELEDFP